MGKGMLRRRTQAPEYPPTLVLGLVLARAFLLFFAIGQRSDGSKRARNKVQRSRASDKKRWGPARRRERGDQSRLGSDRKMSQLGPGRCGHGGSKQDRFDNRGSPSAYLKRLPILKIVWVRPSSWIASSGGPASGQQPMCQFRVQNQAERKATFIAWVMAWQN